MLRTPLSWLKLALFVARLIAARRLGYRIVWTVHEVYPHESSGARLDRAGIRALASQCDVLIVHDDSTAQLARRELGSRADRLAVVPHGSYVGAYPANVGRAGTRESLGISPDAFIFLCFGHVRAYKGIDLLLEAFGRITDPDVALVIAGLPMHEPSVHAVKAAAAADARIHPVLRFIPDEEVADLFAAADVAVLPRSDGGTSGALILALSLCLPVVAADTPDYRRLVAGGKAGWLFEPRDPDSLRCALQRASDDRADIAAKGAAAFEQAQGLQWSKIARATAALMLPKD